MFSLPPHRMEALVEEGHRGARTLKVHKKNPRILVTILVGNNLVNIGLSSIATGSSDSIPLACRRSPPLPSA